MAILYLSRWPFLRVAEAVSFRVGGVDLAIVPGFWASKWQMRTLLEALVSVGKEVGDLVTKLVIG